MPRLCRLLVVAVAGIAAAGWWAEAHVAARDVGRASKLATVARMTVGGIHGVVADDRGVPLQGAMVSALGATTLVAVTAADGRFMLRALPPGVYLVRAHLGGYTPSRRQVVDVRPNTQAISTITLYRASSSHSSPLTTGAAEAPILAAGLGTAAGPAAAAGVASEESATPISDAHRSPSEDDHSDLAWRLRHLKRSVLRDVETGVIAIDDARADEESFVAGTSSFLGRALGSPARFAQAVFGDLPLSGQVNWLSTGTVDRPLQLLSVDGLSHGVAYFSVGAPAGPHGDWSVRGAVAQGNLASWILAGSFARSAPEGHAYDVGMSYSAQRYLGGNPAALAAVSDGSRNAGAVYGYDRWAISPRVSLDYGARYARYDYIKDAGLFSPRVSVNVSRGDRLRIRGQVSRRLLVPGAEEFLPSRAEGPLLPPERTFAPLAPRGRFDTERTQHYEVGVEHEVARGYILGARAFYQRVDDQMVALFGTVADRSALDMGHYSVSSAGDVRARGWSAGISHALGTRLRGSVDYAHTAATWTPSAETTLIAAWAPAAARLGAETFHDVTTAVETEIPETATRVFVLYKINTAFARPQRDGDQPDLGRRFDVRVMQALPFLDFTSADWEVLVAIRNLFREATADASVYDELLVVRPPTRIVGGVRVKF